MKKLLLLLLISQSLFSQSFKPSDCKGDIYAALDSAIKYNGGTLDLRDVKQLTLTRPLVAAKFDSVKNAYVAITIKIIGSAQMWDANGISELRASFKDGPIIALERCKGCLIEGVNIQGRYTSPAMTEQQFFQAPFETYGDTTCRDKPFSPYAGIVIDPFCDVPPPDGGYPTLQKYYKGKNGSGGSTGVFIKNCTVNNVTIGIIFSPNGQTANCELMNVSNIRMYNTKAGFVGCQAQEKNNYLSNINCWGRTHTLFNWGGYGNSTPGFYIIDGVQVAGGVVRLLNRVSGGYFPLYMSNVFTEKLGCIGYWLSAGVGDKLFNSNIGFAYVEDAGGFPAPAHMWGAGVTVENVNIRYYGRYTIPIFFKGEFNLRDITSYVPIISGDRATTVKPGYTMIGSGYTTSNQSPKKFAPGTIVALCDTNSHPYYGLAQIAADSSTMNFISPSIQKKPKYSVFEYKKL